MRIILTTLLACLFGTMVSAQDIVFVEYFWDTDPGVGLGIGSAVGPGSSIDSNIEIDPTGLSAGKHFLYVRTKNDLGQWSVPYQERVIVHELVEAEYFWDEDPGVGNGTSATISTTDLNINEELEIETSGIPGGQHNLGVRTKGKGGKWSPVTWKTVNVATEFSDGEYFFDTDPGVGNGVSFDLPNDQINLDATVAVSTDGLSSGWHTLYTRVRGTGGSFGQNYKKRIYVARDIVSGEYFWDTDPGVGNGTPLGTLTVGTTAQVCDVVSTVGVSDGIHYLYVRTVSEDNVWSVPSRIQITVTPNEFLVGCPGDFDRNGTVAAGDLLAFLSGFGGSGDCTVDLNGDFVVDTSDLLIFLGLFGNDCE